MKKIISTTFVLLWTASLSWGQNIVTDLNGFRLGQFRETTSNEFGQLFEQGRYDDGYEYDAYLIEPDTSIYVIFQYTPENPEVIWSIQISGSPSTLDIGFKGLQLGIEKEKVEQVLGKPDHQEDIGRYGEKWSYDNANYTVEILPTGKLSSVKIIDTYSSNVPDASKLPKFETVVKLLGSKNNADIAEILAPGIEIYYKDQTLFFGKSLKSEIATDHSKIFQTIRELSKGLNKIDTSDEYSYEENMRFSEDPKIKHVVKIKTGHAIKEIVFDYINGKYLIWEILAQ